MSDQYSISALITAFRAAYQTIDLRAALINHENHWQIVSIILRFKIAAQQLVEQEFEQQSKGRKVDSDKFKIIHFCMPFSELERLAGEFSRGQLNLEDLRIAQIVQKDVLGLSGYINFFRKSPNKTSILDWPIFRATTILLANNPYYSILQSDATIRRHIQTAGFDTVDSALKQLLDSDYTYSSINLTVELDIPARIDEVEERKKKDKVISLWAHATTDKTLSDILCNIFKYKTSSDKQFMRQLHFEKRALKESVQEWICEIDLNDTIDDRETIAFDLIHEQLGRLHYYEYEFKKKYKDQEFIAAYSGLTKASASSISILDKIKARISKTKKHPLVYILAFGISIITYFAAFTNSLNDIVAFFSKKKTESTQTEQGVSDKKRDILYKSLMDNVTEYKNKYSYIDLCNEIQDDEKYMLQYRKAESLIKLIERQALTLKENELVSWAREEQCFGGIKVYTNKKNPK